MSSVNMIITVIRIGREPEMRTVPSVGRVANVTIASSDRRSDRTSGEMTDATEWHLVVFNDRLAEISGEYVKKGRPVEGRLVYRKYTDKDGVEKYTTEIRADQMQMLGKRQGMGRRRAGRCPRSSASYVLATRGQSVASTTWATTSGSTEFVSSACARIAPRNQRRLISGGIR